MSNLPLYDTLGKSSATIIQLNPKVLIKLFILKNINGIAKQIILWNLIEKIDCIEEMYESLQCIYDAWKYNDKWQGPFLKKYDKIKKFLQCFMNNGMREGLCKSFFHHYRECYYKNGRQNGTDTLWHTVDEGHGIGRKAEEYEYLEDNIVGNIKRWDEYGILLIDSLN